MTASLLEQNVHYVTNTDGEQIAVQIDLQNKEVRDFFEDLFDTLNVIKVQDESTKSASEIWAEILESRKAKSE